MKHNHPSEFRKLVVGVDTPVPLMNGQYVTAINFDNAATTPPLVSVMNRINDFAPFYASIHRGTGYKSNISSYIYEQARKTIASYVNADLDYDTIIYVKNTTEGINKLAYKLNCHNHGSIILSTYMEHHSNDLPWRHHFHVEHIAITSDGKLCLDDLERKLKIHMGKVKLVAVTGASNVTGYKNPIYTIAEIAHKYGAKILVDGAQLLPHCAFDMMPISSTQHIDFFVFSAHKIYAPFGLGVLIGPKALFNLHSPDEVGGGTVKIVTPNQIIFEDPPHREEAGTPNIMGVVALNTALETLAEIGIQHIEEYEKNLTLYALKHLKKIPHLKLYGNTKDCSNRVGIIPFNVSSINHEQLANIVSNEAGIAVRHGCFCAQPYIQKLLNLGPSHIKKHIEHPDEPHPGMIRISFGMYNTYKEIDILIHLLQKIVSRPNEYIKKYEHIVNKTRLK